MDWWQQFSFFLSLYLISIIMLLLVFVSQDYALVESFLKSLICLIKLTISMSNFRTPLMAAMHEDDSPELAEVARILKDVLEVKFSPILTPLLLSHCP